MRITGPTVEHFIRNMGRYSTYIRVIANRLVIEGDSDITLYVPFKKQVTDDIFVTFRDTTDTLTKHDKPLATINGTHKLHDKANIEPAFSGRYTIYYNDNSVPMITFIKETVDER